jgi:hypothetical protein
MFTSSVHSLRCWRALDLLYTFLGYEANKDARHPFRGYPAYAMKLLVANRCRMSSAKRRLFLPRPRLVPTTLSYPHVQGGASRTRADHLGEKSVWLPRKHLTILAAIYLVKCRFWPRLSTSKTLEKKCRSTGDRRVETNRIKYAGPPAEFSFIHR